MMNTLSITAIIPAHNRARYVGDAVESVLRQERPVDEIIVVDDGSSDGTGAAASAFPQVRLISLPQSKGTSGARNAGLSAASGDVIGWLDSDDVWLPDHTSTAVALLERYPATIVSFTSAEFFGDRRGLWPRPDVPEDEPFDALSVAFSRTISTMSPAVTRRSAVVAVGGFDESLRSSVDFDLFLRLALRGPFVSSARVTSRYRWHGDQISARPTKQLASMYASRDRLLRSLIEGGRRDTAKVLAQGLRTCWHDDLWLAHAKHDAEALTLLTHVAGTLPEISALAEPFGSESLALLRRYCRDRGRREVSEWPDADAPRFLGRPRWLYAQALRAQLKYWSTRLTRRREEWLETFMDAAIARGRLETTR